MDTKTEDPNKIWRDNIAWHISAIKKREQNARDELNRQQTILLALTFERTELEQRLENINKKL